MYEHQIQYLAVVLQQIQHQQDVRDRWFRYYLTISGGVFALGVTTSGLLSEGGGTLAVPWILALVSSVMAVIGRLFLLVYIRQRHNYLRLYEIMNEIELNLHFLGPRAPAFGEKGQRPGDDCLVRRAQAKGADYYAAHIHLTINAAYVSCAAMSALIAALPAYHIRPASIVGLGLIVGVLSLRVSRSRILEELTPK